MKLLVVGAGEMGRWFGRTLRAELPDDLDVAFADTDPDAADAAATALDARAVPTDASERFDVICVAVPIPAAAAVITEYADRAERALVDVTGVMAEPVEAMADAAPTVERASFHPLFAAENAPGNVAVVADAPGPVTDRIRDALAAAGNDLFETTPAEHDRAMETVQASTHAAVLAFGLAAEDVDDAFQTPISAALFETLDQVTGNDAGVYADIQDAFDGAADVAESARRIADADRETFEQLYEDARPEGRSDDARLEGRSDDARPDAGTSGRDSGGESE